MEYSDLLKYAFGLTFVLVTLTYAYRLFHIFQLRNIRILRELVRRMRKHSERTFEFCQLIQESLKETEERLKELEEKL